MLFWHSSFFFWYRRIFSRSVCSSSVACDLRWSIYFYNCAVFAVSFASNSFFALFFSNSFSISPNMRWFSASKCASYAPYSSRECCNLVMAWSFWPSVCFFSSSSASCSRTLVRKKPFSYWRSYSRFSKSSKALAFLLLLAGLSSSSFIMRSNYSTLPCNSTFSSSTRRS